MEREILLTGIGGQGVQLAAQILARAAVLDDRHVMLLGVYGGTMRGGNTDSTVVVGDAPLKAPPIVSRAWAAVAMHHAFWRPVREKLRPGSLVVANSDFFEAELDRDTKRVFEVPAVKIATECGSPMAASLVLLAAFASVSDLLPLECLIEGMRESVPSYRTQHIEANEKALRAGYQALPHAEAPAWKELAA